MKSAMPPRQDTKALRATLLTFLVQPLGFEARKGAEIDRVAQAVLAKAGITSPRIVDERHPDTKGRGAIFAPSWRIAADAYPKGSPEYTAAVTLDCLARVRLAIQTGDTDAAAEDAVTLGVLAAHLGKKMICHLTGKASIARVHGTDAQRDAVNSEIIEEFNREKAKAPGQKIGDIERMVAKTLRTSVRKVQRARARKKEAQED